jgi:hypothetical protein
MEWRPSHGSMVIGQVSDDCSGLGWPKYKLAMVFQSEIRQDTMQEATSMLCYIEQAFVATSNANNSLPGSSSIVYSAMELQSQSNHFPYSSPRIPLKVYDHHSEIKNWTAGIGISYLLHVSIVQVFGFIVEARVGCSPHTRDSYMQAKPRRSVPYIMRSLLISI